MASAHFLLFIAGDTPKNKAIIEQLRGFCRLAYGEGALLEVIDVLNQPQRADEEHILATPTLLRLRPLPRRYIIGDLSSRAKLLSALDLPNPEQNQEES